LQNTIFVSYKIHNTSGRRYNNFYIGFFADFDICNATDDYICCDTLLNLSYGYNGNATDEGKPWSYGEHPPAQGVMFLNQKMSGFTYFSNDTPGAMGDPETANQYYNYMQARWKDGTRLTYGKTGYNPGTTNYTNFAFSGDPVTKTGWTEVTPNGSGSTPNTPSDRRGLMSIGPFDFHNTDICIDIALPFAQDLEGDNISSVVLLKQRARAIQECYNNLDSCAAPPVEIKENKVNSSKVQIYPNPSNGQFVVSCNKTIESFELYDAVGRKVFIETPKTESTQINVQLPQGLYIYRAVLQDHSVCSGKVAVQ
jgi:hypothetical protein